MEMCAGAGLSPDEVLARRARATNAGSLIAIAQRVAAEGQPVTDEDPTHSVCSACGAVHGIGPDPLARMRERLLELEDRNRRLEVALAQAKGVPR